MKQATATTKPQPQLQNNNGNNGNNGNNETDNSNYQGRCASFARDDSIEVEDVFMG